MSKLILDPESGYALSADHQRIAEIIQDYDSRLKLGWIPPDKRTGFDGKPFAIICTQDDGFEYIVVALREEDVDHRLIGALFRAAGGEGNQLDIMEAEEAARKVLQMKSQMDDFEEKQDFAKFALASRKNYIRHNGKVYS